MTGKGFDFSKGGMRLFLTLGLDLGAPLVLEFVLPYTSTPMVVRSVVRNQNEFHYGIEFLGVSPYQPEMLERNCAVLNLLS
jgi:PilZ domain